MEWARDSAYRSFPLVLHEDLGLVPHSFDLATNKVLALVERLEDAGELSRRWRVLLDAVRHIVSELPADEIGTCVLTRRGELFTGNAEHLERALADGEIPFHPGRVRGAFPRLLP